MHEPSQRGGTGHDRLARPGGPLGSAVVRIVAPPLPAKIGSAGCPEINSIHDKSPTEYIEHQQDDNDQP